MQIPPRLKQLLDTLGVNTTRLQWRLYQWEQRSAERRGQSSLPPGLRWMKYEHKFCPRCGALVDRRTTTCPHCGASVPSVGLYKIMRALGLVFPREGLLTVGLFVFVIMLLYGLSVITGEGETLLQNLLAPTRRTLYRFGLMDPVFVRNGEYWRLLSFGLFHFGLIHLMFNTIALLQIGPMLEQEIGSRRLLVLITVSQLASASAVQFWNPIGAVGASGWLFGLIGFGISFYHRQGGRLLPHRNFFIQWAMYGFLFSLIFRFNNTAHFGGFAGGFLLGWIADLSRARRTVWTQVWDFLTWPSLLAWLVTLGCLARAILRG